LIAAICLLPPTVLMGASLPAIARWFDTTPKGVSWMGYLYSANIAGAVAGSLLAGFYILRTSNMTTATFVAASINIVIALTCLGLAGRIHYVPGDSVAVRRATRAPGVALGYLAIALSGACALGAEVVWTRLLSLLFGATVYTFSIILAVFL